MQFNITVITIVVLVAIVWILMETKKFRHKMTEFFMIFIILFAYFSFTFVLSGKSVDLSNWEGIKQAGSIYLSWLGSIFSNLKTLTTNAIHMNWGSGNAASPNVTSILNLTNSS